MLFYLVGVLVITTLPLALLKVLRNQGTGLDITTVILNGQCLYQIYQFLWIPSTSNSYHGLGTFISLFFLLATCSVLSTVWLIRHLFPGLRGGARS
ncbi:MAG: hypothetical protein U0931_29920 [Vulcanimicrobiota bacterium]